MRQQTFRGTGILLLALVLVTVLWFAQALQDSSQQRLTNQEFLSILDSVEVSGVTIRQRRPQVRWCF